ncbi:MAG: hypothetical protein WKF73_11685 [Nocardioidaceae bacterium]
MEHLRHWLTNKFRETRGTSSSPADQQVPRDADNETPGVSRIAKSVLNGAAPPVG